MAQRISHLLTLLRSLCMLITGCALSLGSAFAAPDTPAAKKKSAAAAAKQAKKSKKAKTEASNARPAGKAKPGFRKVKDTAEPTPRTKSSKKAKAAPADVPKKRAAKGSAQKSSSAKTTASTAGKKSRRPLTPQEKRAADWLKEPIRPAQPAEKPKPPLPPSSSLKAPVDPAQRQVTIKSLRFTNATAISQEELMDLVGKDYVGKTMAVADMRKLTTQVSREYRQRNLMAHAYVRPESMLGGELDVVVVESKLGAVRVDAEPGLRMDTGMARGYVTSQQTEGEALRIDKVDKGVRLLNEVPGVSATSTLTSGQKPEQTDVVLKLQDKPLVTANARVDNHGSKSTGTLRAIGIGSLNNPSGIGDKLTATGVASTRSSFGRVAYEAPIGTSGFRAGASAGIMNYNLGGSFSTLQNSGTSTSFGVNASHPLIRDSRTSLTATAAFDNRSLADESLNVRILNRRTNAGNFGLQMDHTSALGLTNLGAGLTLGKLGLDAGSSDFTTDQAGPRAAGTYSKVVWSAAHLAPLNSSTELAASASGQFASKNLDSSEKHSLGGPNAIRAYSAFEASGDEGWLGKFEVRHTLFPQFKVLAFVDMGRTTLNKNLWSTWNSTNPDLPNSYMLYGTGAGIHWQAPYDLEVQASVATPIGSNPGKPSNIEESGFLKRTNAWINVNRAF